MCGNKGVLKSTRKRKRISRNQNLLLILSSLPESPSSRVYGGHILKSNTFRPVDRSYKGHDNKMSAIKQSNSPTASTSIAHSLQFKHNSASKEICSTRCQ